MSSVLPEQAPADPGRAKPSDVRVITRATFRADGAGYRDGARHSRIYLVAVRSGREPVAGRQLDGTRISELEPTYSADGRTLFFRGRDVEETDFTPAKTLLYAVDAGGGTPRIVATIDGAATELSPSPDGRLIAFQGAANVTPVQSYTQSDLFVVDISNGAVRNLTRGGDTDIGGGLAGDRTRASRRRVLTAGMDARQHRAAPTISAARAGGPTSFASESPMAQRRLSLRRATRKCRPSARAPMREVSWAPIATPTNIGDLFVVDTSSDSPGPQRITSVNDALFRTLDLPAPQPLVVKSFDGKSVDGWYVTPPAFDATRSTR